MAVSAKLMAELNKKHNIIENSLDELYDMGGTSIGVRLGSVFKLVGEGRLNPKASSYPIAQKEVDIANNDIKIILDPGGYRLLKTMEILHLPAQKIVLEEGKEPALLVADLHPILALQQCGILFIGGRFQPGHSGMATVGMVNSTQTAFQIDLGARIANLSFDVVVGTVDESAQGKGKEDAVHQLEGSSF